MTKFRKGQTIKVFPLKKLEQIGTKGFCSRGYFNTKEEMEKEDFTEEDLKILSIFPPYFDFENARKCKITGLPIAGEEAFPIEEAKSVCGEEIHISGELNDDGSIFDEEYSGVNIYPWMCKEVGIEANPCEYCVDPFAKVSLQYSNGKISPEVDFDYCPKCGKKV